MYRKNLNKMSGIILFAQDGSFARCEIEINEEFLKNVAFNTSHMRYNMINKWSRIAE